MSDCVNLNSFSNELRAAGLPGHCASNGRVDFDDGTSWKPGQIAKTSQEILAEQVFSSHNKISSDLNEVLDKNNELLIQQEIRNLAIGSLKAKGLM